MEHEQTTRSALFGTAAAGVNVGILVGSAGGGGGGDE